MNFSTETPDRGSLYWIFFTIHPHLLQNFDLATPCDCGMGWIVICGGTARGAACLGCGCGTVTCTGFCCWRLPQQLHPMSLSPELADRHHPRQDVRVRRAALYPRWDASRIGGAAGAVHLVHPRVFVPGRVALAPILRVLWALLALVLLSLCQGVHNGLFWPRRLPTLPV